MNKDKEFEIIVELEQGLSKYDTVLKNHTVADISYAMEKGVSSRRRR